MEFNHKTVLLEETIEFLNIDSEGVYVDGTAGGAGLSLQIASRISDKGMLLCIDQDPDAISTCREKLKNFNNVKIVQDNFSNIKNIVHNNIFRNVNGVVFDLGVSSYQLDEAERGFSYKQDAPLDMRMSKSGESAFDVVNSMDYSQLKYIISAYGEERFSSNIAAKIVKKREKKPIETTLELAEIIKDAIPFYSKREGSHPAKRTFQAIRIYVNKELDNLEKGLDGAFEVLAKGGRLLVITFHSLEDRIVKLKMNKWCEGCVCPPDFPVCVCGNAPKARLVHRKVIKPSEKELNLNSRSRSAKLRVCEKII